MIATTADWDLARIAAVAAAIGFAGIALFQGALAAGAPLGRAAWGGAHAGQLPGGLRIASGVAILVWAAASLLLLRRGGLGVLAIPEGAAVWGAWILCGLSAVGALMNLASSSGWERFFWAPYALILAGLCAVAARG
jgi:hypothetical protein